jgi:hypothetical protein
MEHKLFSTAGATAPSRAASAFSSLPAEGATSAAGTRPARQDGLKDKVMDPSLPRTKEEMMSEVRYGVVFADMNESANAWLRGVSVFLTALCALLTTGGFAALALKAAPDYFLWWSLGLGAVAAVALAANKAFKFAEREEQFRAAKTAFQTLEGKGWCMEADSLDKELHQLRNKAPTGGRWLAELAYNRTCREIGHPEVRIPVPTLLRPLEHVV